MVVLLGLLPGWGSHGAPEPAPKPSASPTETFWRQGHQLTVEFGAGGDSGDLTGLGTTFNTGLGAATAIHYSYRFNSLVAFGPRIFYSFMDADIEGHGATSDDSAYAVGVDLAVTGYPLRSTRFDPFFGLSVGYAMWTVPVMDGSVRRNHRLHGVTLQLNVGLDIYVTHYFSVGPVFRYHFPFWIQYCITGPGDHCDSVEDITAVNEVFDESLPGLVFVGAQAVFHIR